MTALADGSAGLALVTGLMLLQTRQTSPAIILLAVQSAAVALAAIMLHHPALAMPPLLLAAGAWLMFGTQGWPQYPDQSGVQPAGGSKAAWSASARTRSAAPGLVGVVAGSILAVLCQSQGPATMPLAIILLAALFAALRRDRMSHALALVALGNSLALAASLIFPDGADTPALLPLACLLLPLPLAAGLTAAGLIDSGGRPARVAPQRTASVNRIGWIDVMVAVLVFAATGLLPLDPLASVFAPLLALDGILRSCRRRKRAALSFQMRGLALLSNVFPVLAVCQANPVGAWLAVLAAIVTYAPPTRPQSWDTAVSALFGAGTVLLGLLILAAAPLVPGYVSVFIGSVMIAAAVPDLAVVMVILILRLATHAPWPHLAESLGIGLALTGVLTCAARLVITRASASLSTVWCVPATLLQSGQTGLAALAICTGDADGRFAGLVLLALIILMRAAARDTDRTVALLARAGLGGVPLGGVFPGLVLVVLAASSHDIWLLLPLGLAVLPMLAASLPHRLPHPLPRPALTVAAPSIGWLPLIFAWTGGYFAPEGLIRWCHALTTGQ